VPPFIAALVFTRVATLRELQSDYGAEDAYDLMELAAVDLFNRRPLEP
jgi:hypothetical protein